jgi:hypothetical protein
MITELGICDEFFGTRELGIIFTLSKQTEVNEITDDPNHLRMQFVEFVEVIGRTADKVPYDSLK